MNSQRLDQALVARGLVLSRQKAQERIASQKVTVNGKVASKASQQVCESDELVLLEAERFVSRAGEKLLAALEHFKVDVSGAKCLDVGASTGGFTDCLLQFGAAHVTAIDVGHNQLVDKIKKDLRVESYEGVNARDLSKDIFPDDFKIIVVDVSFISILKILPAIVDLVDAKGTLVALVKPQFEAGRESLDKHGIVRDATKREACVQRVSDFFRERSEWRVLGTIPSPITGGDGNQEYLLCAQKFAA